MARRKALADATAGVIGSLLSLWTFYPIEVWKTVIQAGKQQQRPDKTKLSLSSVYKGCQMKSLYTATSSFTYFFLSSWIISRWTMRNRRPQHISAAARLVLTAVAAMLNVLVTLPLDVLSSKSVTGRTDEGEDKDELEFEEDEDENMTQAWADVQDSGSDDEKEAFRENGKLMGGTQVCKAPSPRSLQKKSKCFRFQDIFFLWKGLLPAVLLCSNPAINYTAFDVAKSYVLSKPDRRRNLSMAESFLLGLFAKSVATIATYPLIRAKVMLMVTSETSMLTCLRQTYEKNGVKGLYKGCDWQLLHTALKSALMMMIREQVSVSTHRILVGDETRASR